jgi:HEAT repeat protein
MAKARGLRNVDAKLQRLHALRNETASPELIAELRKALTDASNLVVAEAAEIIAAQTLTELTAELATTFERFMIDFAETDKLCRAKLAIVTALNKLEYDRDESFLRGICHIQREAVWGGTQDTAGELRGESAFGLVRIDHPDVLLLLTELLTDPEKTARRAAAQGLGASGKLACIPLLRFKARTGDEDATVTSECLTGLLRLAPQESLSFVARFLSSANDAVQEGAAFALAESRRPEALPILKDYWQRHRRDTTQEVALLAISMLRIPAAIDCLLEVVAGPKQRDALAALTALAIHRHNATIKSRIGVAVEAKGDEALRARFAQKFAT